MQRKIWKILKGCKQPSLRTLASIGMRSHLWLQKAMNKQKPSQLSTQEESEPRHLGINQHSTLKFTASSGQNSGQNYEDKPNSATRGVPYLNYRYDPFFTAAWAICRARLSESWKPALKHPNLCNVRRNASTTPSWCFISSELFYLLSKVKVLKKHMSEDPSRWTHQSIDEAQSILVLWELDHTFSDFHNFTHDPTDTWAIRCSMNTDHWSCANPCDMPEFLTLLRHNKQALHSTTSILQFFQGWRMTSGQPMLTAASVPSMNTHNMQLPPSGLSCSSGEPALPGRLRTSLGDRVGSRAQHVSTRGCSIVFFTRDPQKALGHAGICSLCAMLAKVQTATCISVQQKNTCILHPGNLLSPENGPFQKECSNQYFCRDYVGFRGGQPLNSHAHHDDDDDDDDDDASAAWSTSS